MLSICIPLYNYNVTTLVSKLVTQINNLKITAEILILDDGSAIEFKKLNRQINNIDQVNYIELATNLGSAGIRNRLAKQSKYNYILFIDSDSDIPQDYIEKYIPFINSDKEIVCGGRVHPVNLPSPDHSLRWKVGKKKEDFSAEFRRKIPNKSFMSNNFLTTKQMFSEVSFDETIERSGHEDTIFGIELEKKGIAITHIDNPVVHIGLETNLDFVKKTEQRLETLQYLTSLYKRGDLMYKRITILKYYQILNTLKLNKVYAIFYKMFNKIMKKHLCTLNPSMLVYDLYKLGYYNTLTT